MRSQRLVLSPLFAATLTAAACSVDLDSEAPPELVPPADTAALAFPGDSRLVMSGQGGAQPPAPPVLGSGGSSSISGVGGALPVSGSGGSSPISGAGGSPPVSGAGGSLPISGVGGSSSISGTGGSLPVSGAGGAPPASGGGGTGNDACIDGTCMAVATCSDGIQNQGETGIDCGGPCPPCPLGTAGNPATSCLALKTAVPGTASGTYWIDTDGAGAKPAVQAYCDMTTDGGGYTFYPVTDALNSCRYTDDNSCKAVGMDIVMPRTKGHWQSMFARYGAAYFATVPGVYKPEDGGDFRNCTMRNPLTYGYGCPLWRVGDGKAWWIRDSSFTEPSGDYTANCWLGLTAAGYAISAATINDGQGFNDDNCTYCTTKYICSTNDFAPSMGSTPATAVRSCRDIHLRNPDLASGTYWIDPDGADPIAPFQAYCDMTTDGGGYTYYPVSGGVSTCRYTDDNSCKARGMDIVMPRTKAHWQAMFARYGAAYFATVPGVYKTTNNGDYTTCVMRDPNANDSGCDDWRVGDGKRWWIRDSVFTEPNGDYTANCWLGLTAAGYAITAATINDGQGFNDNNCTYCTTSYICSTND